MTMQHTRKKTAVHRGYLWANIAKSSRTPNANEQLDVIP